MKNKLTFLDVNSEGYKNNFINTLKADHDFSRLDNAVIYVDNDIQLFLKTKSLSVSILQEIGIYKILNENKGKKNISIFCNSKQGALIDYFADSEEYVLELGYFRWSPIPKVLIKKEGFEDIEIKFGSIDLDKEELLFKCRRDFLEPYKDVYSDELISKYIDDLRVAFDAPYLHAIKNGKVVGYLIDEIYYEKRLLLEYYLIGFVWIERALLNNNERSFISNNFFNYLSIKEAPFGAIINYTNHISRKYFERNGFVPNWIRASLRNENEN